MRILISGSTGYLGSHLLPKLLASNHELLAITRQDPMDSLGCRYHIDSFDQSEFVHVVNDFRPQICIHLASYLTAADDFSSLQNLLDANIVFTCRLLDALKDSKGLKLFINTGTFAEYYQGDHIQDPAYLYAASKTAARSFLKYYASTYHFKSTTVVPYTIYGGRLRQDKIIDLIFNSMSSFQPVDLTAGEQVLDFIHIDDVVDFYALLIDNFNQVPNQSNFYLGTGRGHSIRQLAAIMEELAGKKANVNWGGREYRERDTFYSVANLSLQYRLWNWQPKISLIEGVKQYIKDRIYVT